MYICIYIYICVAYYWKLLTLCYPSVVLADPILSYVLCHDYICWLQLPQCNIFSNLGVMFYHIAICLQSMLPPTCLLSKTICFRVPWGWVCQGESPHARKMQLRSEVVQFLLARLHALLRSCNNLLAKWKLCIWSCSLEMIHHIWRAPHGFAYAMTRLGIGCPVPRLTKIYSNAWRKMLACLWLFEWLIPIICSLI